MHRHQPAELSMELRLINVDLSLSLALYQLHEMFWSLDRGLNPPHSLCTCSLVSYSSIEAYSIYCIYMSSTVQHPVACLQPSLICILPLPANRLSPSTHKGRVHGHWPQIQTPKSSILHVSEWLLYSNNIINNRLVVILGIPAASIKLTFPQ